MNPRSVPRTVVLAAAVSGLLVYSAATASGRIQATPAGTPQASPSAGQTIWDGVYSAAQAKRGEASAAKSCATCHSAELTGGQDGPSLVGPEILDAWSTLTLGDVFDRIRTTMPADAPMSLSPREVADILAYVLSVNKCPAGEQELPADVAALRQVRVTARPQGKAVGD